MSAEKLIQDADAYLKTVDVADLHPDVQSLVATYKSHQKAKDRRGQVAFAKAIVRRARAAGYDPDGAKAVKDMTVAELKAEIDRRNEGREDAAKLSKTGSKDELVAALEADDSAE